MNQAITPTPVDAQYQQEEKPILVLTHDQRKSIISVMNTAAMRIYKEYGEKVHNECLEFWKYRGATKEEILKDIFSLFEVRVCDYQSVCKE